jgi:small subunit ribosomal protein S9
MATARYIEGIGRRKTAVARVRITPSKKNTFVINEKTLEDYFPTEELQKVVTDALDLEKVTDTFDVSVKVSGSGIHSQAEAVRHGLARGLNEHDGDLRGDLKKAGFLKRDSRSVERKKAGFRKARKKEQWSKR